MRGTTTRRVDYIWAYIVHVSLYIQMLAILKSGRDLWQFQFPCDPATSHVCVLVHWFDTISNICLGEFKIRLFCIRFFLYAERVLWEMQPQYAAFVCQASVSILCVCFGCFGFGFREFAFVAGAQMIASTKTGNLAIYLNFI